MNSRSSPPLYTGGLKFDYRYLEHKSYFATVHGLIPDINLLAPLDGEAAFMAFQTAFAAQIVQVHTYRPYDPVRKRYRFDRTIVRLADRLTLEFGDSYCEILHDGHCAETVARFTTFLHPYLDRRRREPEVHLVVRGENGPELRAVAIRRTRLDLGLYYEDDFRDVDAHIRSRLARKTGKGLVLLHGLPGTGKTTYLRYLVGRLRKRVLFLSPGIAGDLMNPSFIELLMDHPSSVLVIEDAESILTDRRLGSNNSSVSALLNLSDGLLADFLNVQLVCTFNSPLTAIDSALLREGRLIASYQFGKLSQPKAQRLSERLGSTRVIDGPATLAEVLHPHQCAAPAPQAPIGFRRNFLQTAS